MESVTPQSYPVEKSAEPKSEPIPMPDDPDAKTPVGGFDPVELIKAPIAPPTNVNPETRHATSNPRVRFLIYASIALFVVGCVILPISVVFGLVIMALAALSVILSVFAPID